MDFKSDILFKDNLDYIEAVFEKLGITYDSMGLMFSIADVTNNKLEKIIKKYPALEKYMCPHNQSVDGPMRKVSSGHTAENGSYTLRVDKSEHEILRELVKKTPRPFNFGAISIFIDNVRWFPEEEINTTPCIIGEYSPNVKPSPYYPQSYMSNNMILIKQFDYGKKFNPVWFTIEVGDENSEIKDITELEEKLSDLLGKPFGTRYYQTKYHFYFSDKEKEHLAQQDKTFATTFNPIATEIRDLVNHAEKIQQIKEMSYTFPFAASGNSRTSGLSLIKALKKVLPAKMYNYTNKGGGFFTIEKKNENNHSFILECSMTPSFKRIDAGIVISAHNFKHNIGSAYGMPLVEKFDAIHPNIQEELEYHIANLAVALKKCEAELSDELLRLYGKSVI